MRMLAAFPAATVAVQGTAIREGAAALRRAASSDAVIADESCPDGVHYLGRLIHIRVKRMAGHGAAAPGQNLTGLWIL